MKRFNQLEYLTQCTDLDNNISSERNTERGLITFLSDALSIIDTNTQDREKGLSVVELGIGGGGSHDNWSNHLSNDCTVYGIDLFHRDHYLNYKNEIPIARNYYLENFPEQVALLLPLSGDYKREGESIQNGFHAWLGRLNR